jgi:hypothetical protein
MIRPYKFLNTGVNKKRLYFLLRLDVFTLTSTRVGWPEYTRYGPLCVLLSTGSQHTDRMRNSLLLLNFYESPRTTITSS